MKNTVSLNAYAKINLTLDITGKRSDGYHGLKSIMIPVSLCDRIEVEKADKISFSCSKSFLSDGSNLCVRAAEAYFAALGIKGGARIYLEKNIPVAAGLGGGSSDASAVLRALDLLFGRTDEKLLLDIALSLGSDVPFCFYGGSALCEGRGELLTPINIPGERFFVVAIGRERLSTARAFAEYDIMSTAPTHYTDALIKAVSDGKNDLEKYFGNCFSSVCGMLCPESQRLISLLCASGAKCAHISGSGPSVFAVYESESAAVLARDGAIRAGFEAYSCKML